MHEFQHFHHGNAGFNNRHQQLFMHPQQHQIMECSNASVLPPCFATLPQHSFNYQDFSPSLYSMADSIGKDGSKTWRKRKSKRAIPEDVIRERQLRRNERERARQNRINDAFDVLRNTIPDFLTPCKKGQKLTQIETLRLAKHYIAGLRELLEKDESSTNFENSE